MKKMILIMACFFSVVFTTTADCQSVVTQQEIVRFIDGVTAEMDELKATVAALSGDTTDMNLPKIATQEWVDQRITRRCVELNGPAHKALKKQTAELSTQQEANIIVALKTSQSKIEELERQVADLKSAQETNAVNVTTVNSLQSTIAVQITELQQIDNHLIREVNRIDNEKLSKVDWQCAIAMATEKVPRLWGLLGKKEKINARKLRTAAGLPE